MLKTTQYTALVGLRIRCTTPYRMVKKKKSANQPYELHAPV